MPQQQQLQYLLNNYSNNYKKGQFNDENCTGLIKSEKTSIADTHIFNLFGVYEQRARLLYRLIYFYMQNDGKKQ